MNEINEINDKNLNCEQHELGRKPTCEASYSRSECERSELNEVKQIPKNLLVKQNYQVLLVKQNYQVLLVGSGGREHAICRKLAKSQCDLFYYGTHENPGMSQYAKLLDAGDLTDNSKITQLALDNKIDMVIIGPEKPLFNGLADKLLENNIPVIGPTQNLAVIETSKYFARNLMIENGLGHFCPKLLQVIYPGYDKVLINQILKTIMKSYKIVLKPDGIYGGKGVWVQDEHFSTKEEIIDYCHQLATFGQITIIEEKLVGEEFAIMSFTDGNTFKHMIPVKDYKRLKDGDCGPNTGSMGSVTGYNGRLWFLNENDIKICHLINEKIIALLKEKSNGQLYKGILYGSFMKTMNKEIKVIEFNARFGDPEVVNVLELLENDLLDIFTAINNGTLDQINLRFKKNASVFKYKIPPGYPDKGVKGDIVELKQLHDDMIYASITKNKNNKYLTLGSRTFGVVKTGKDISQVCCDVNKLLDEIEDTLFYRKDIGQSLSLSYRNSGVNIQEKEKALSEIKNKIESTYTDDVMSQFGDFAGIMKFGNDNLLVTSTDGVGTKSILVLEHFGYDKGFEMLGRDLVNLNVNDILVKGAEPMFFLDYFGCSKLDASHLKHFIRGVTEACKEIGCVLLKGETAQMPDIYQPNTFDLVGTVIGSCRNNDLINGKTMIQKGDLVVSLPSHGPHTNGFTLIRKILDRLKPYEDIDPIIINSLCAPHKCYYGDIITLRSLGVRIHGLCHITGGGLSENPPRVLPDGLTINYFNKQMPYIFEYLQDKGHLSDDEMRRTFNCGVGMMVIIPNEDILKIKGIDYLLIGRI